MPFSWMIFCMRRDGVMNGGRWRRWLALGLAVLLAGGCASGIILEKRHQDGKADRLRMDSLDGWTSWDHRFTNRHDEMGVVFKKENTF